MKIHAFEDGYTGQSTQPITISPAPHLNQGFSEGRAYSFMRPSERLTLIIDDEEIRCSEIGGVWQWRWAPGFYAGTVRAELLGSDRQSVAKYLLDVCPAPEKVGQELFEAMIEEIRNGLPELLPGSEPAIGKIGREGHQADDLVLFARLRHYSEEFQRGLAAVLARPRTRIGHTRRQIPLHRVKRVDSLAARQIARAAPWLASGINTESMANASRMGQGLSIASYQVDLDSAANRAIRALVEALLRRSRQLETALIEMSRKPDPGGARTDILNRLPRRMEFLDQFSSGMTRILRRPPLNEVSRAEVSAAGLNAVSADPAYAHAYRIGRRALGRGVAGRPEDSSWLSPTWEVYERWCYLGLMKGITRLLTGSRPVRVLRPTCNATVQHEWHTENRRVQLLLQPRVPSGDQKANAGFLSISGPREPDIVLCRRDVHGDRFLVFDAKYRVSRQNVLDAMSSAHIYRDSLRLHDQPPEFSCLLVPKGGGAPWLEEESIQHKRGVGVIPFSPEVVPDVLRDRIAKFVRAGQS